MPKFGKKNVCIFLFLILFNVGFQRDVFYKSNTLIFYQLFVYFSSELIVKKKRNNVISKPCPMFIMFIKIVVLWRSNVRHFLGGGTQKEASVILQKFTNLASVKCCKIYKNAYVFLWLNTHEHTHSNTNICFEQI